MWVMWDRYAVKLVYQAPVLIKSVKEWNSYDKDKEPLLTTSI